MQWKQFLDQEVKQYFEQLFENWLNQEFTASQPIIGWSMAERMTPSLVCAALRMAIFQRKRPINVIVHSDRGSQYGSHLYRE